LVDSEAGALESGALQAELRLTSRWDAGYCAELRVTNRHASEPTETWQAVVDLGGATVTSAWNGEWTGATGEVRVNPVSWNARLAPLGGTATVGFCADRRGAADPSILALTSNLSAPVSLLTNGAFERGANGVPEAWRLTRGGVGVSGTWAPDCGRGGSGCVKLSVQAPTRADVGFTQRVSGLKPLHGYVLRGYAKAVDARPLENLRDDATVVNLSFAGHYEFPMSPGGLETRGTFDWKRFQYDVTTRPDGVLNPVARLGFTWNEAAGQAWFDDLELVENPDLRVEEGQHVAFTVWKSDAQDMSDAALARWVGHLDAAYEAMQELTGRVPYAGEKIGYYWPKWARVGGACWSSNPIACDGGDRPETRRFMARIAETDDWGFGQVHELGHLFQFGPFAFEAEFFANWHLYYAITTRNGTAGDGGMTSFWQNKYQDYWVSQRVAHHDGLQYKWILIQEAIGWEPFKMAYRYMGDHLAELPRGSWELVSLWHDKLSEYSGQDVWSFFSPEEIAMMREQGIR
jgi:hypothetical protein